MSTARMTKTSQGMTPRQIVAELDKYIVGQKEAKRSVAIAVRNRYRRLQLPAEMAQEVQPKNILLIGPTGVGKTEIARRLARLTDSPFLKVEASKFTEVGYVGRDVESMIRDLVKGAINELKERRLEELRPRIEEAVKAKIIDILSRSPAAGDSKEELQRRFDLGMLEDEIIEITIKNSAEPMVDMVGGPMGMGPEMEKSIQDMLSQTFSRMPAKSRSMKVKEARQALISEELAKHLDQGDLSSRAIRWVEESGIVFIDEIDKVAARQGGQGLDVSREGVQRDLLPLVEGTAVTTRQGVVHTDHILFIAAGAFHSVKPSDLMPELQGRFPLRTELHPLRTEDFVRILTEPENSLTKQYKALMAVDGVDLEFTSDGIQEMARLATLVNEQMEDIGARRLYTLLENALEDVSYGAPDTVQGKVIIDKSWLDSKLKDIVEDQHLSKSIL